jgi:hypothetical protein
MKWKMANGKEIEISDMDDNHARNSINMLIKNLSLDMDDSHAQNSINMLVRNSSPQAILLLICEANQARIDYNEKLKNRRKFNGLNGDMAQQFNSMSRDMEEWGDYPYEESPFDGL